MPELRNLSGNDVVKALERLGFRQARQKGSHVVMRKETSNGSFGCAVPLHKEIKIGTLKGLLKLAKVDIEDFKKVI